MNSKKPSTRADTTASQSGAKPRRSVVRQPRSETYVAEFVLRHKKLGLDTLASSPAAAAVKEWIPTGIVGVDTILGGGFAVGRFSEMSGAVAAGKTALAVMALRSTVRLGGLPVLIDFERSVDPTRMHQQGIKEDELVYLAPTCLEDGLAKLEAICEKLASDPPRGPSLIVWDSLVSAIPKVELEGKVDSQRMGLRAAAINKVCLRMVERLPRARAHLMWINQVRDKMNKMPYGPQTDTPGGWAPKFYASQRIECRQVFKERDSQGNVTGYVIRVDTLKNRGVRPHQQTEWILSFREGPSPALSALHVLRRAGVIKTVGGKMQLRLDGQLLKFNKKEWRELLRDSDVAPSINQLYASVVTAGRVKKAKHDNDNEA